MNKKLLVLILTVSMLLAMLPSAVFAEETAPEETPLELIKYASEPDEEGIIWLNLETYATGKTMYVISTRRTPLDIVLVLDTSGSMAEVSTEKYYIPHSYESFSEFKSIVQPHVLYNGEYLTVEISSSEDQPLGRNAYSVLDNEGTVMWDTDGDGCTWTDDGDSDAIIHPRDAGLPTDDNFFYSYEGKKRITLLKEAVNSFMESVYADACANEVEHRIAATAFSFANEEIFEMTSLTPDIDMGVLKGKIDSLEEGGATAADLGMEYVMLS